MAIVKTQPTAEIATGDNAPDMGTLGASAETGQKVDPFTARLQEADPGITNAREPGAATDINDILQPYINELMNLGPEYGAEMEYLKPYVTGQGPTAPQTFQGIEAASQAQESPTGNTSLQQAIQAQGQAEEKSLQDPGFGELATAGEEFANTVPYSQLLQTLLGAGKNEILYGTTPNISNVNTQGWPSSLQNAYSFLTQAATGTNAQTGLQSPQQAAKGAQKNKTGATFSGGTTQGGGSSG